MPKEQKLKRPDSRLAVSQSRSGPTRRRVLDAALLEFASNGYENTSIANIVQRSGVSVGSIYHHFGGKSEVFLALWEENREHIWTETSTATNRALRSAVTDTMELFIIGARAYMEAIWERREQARVFFIMEGPPGFQVRRYEESRAWNRRNIKLFELDERPLGSSLAMILRGALGQAAIEICQASNVRAARAIMRDVETVFRQLQNLT